MHLDVVSVPLRDKANPEDFSSQMEPSVQLAFD